MARLIWTEPALDDLNEISEYIALDDVAAAKKLVQKVFAAVDRLSRFPKSGRIPPEVGGSIYREVVVPPCRVFYRIQGKTVFVLYVLRSEMEIRKFLISERNQE